MRAKKTGAPPTLLKQSSPAASALANDAPLPPRIALPSDLSISLRYLGDAELQRPHTAVNTEIDRRGQGASTGKAGKVVATGAFQPVQAHKGASDLDEIPDGKANLIRASF